MAKKPVEAKLYSGRDGTDRRRSLKAQLRHAMMPENKLPYPFCWDPEACKGKGYCQKDPACNN